MSKKNKRQVQKPVSTAPAASTSAPVMESAPTRSGDRDFTPDYSYVKKDLKRIATLAGTFFAILIILSFILN